MYNGIYTQYGSQSSLIVTENGSIFSGAKYIEEGSTLQVTQDTINYNGVHLGTSANYTHYSATDNGGTINDNLLEFTSAGATATFSTDPNNQTVTSTKYILTPIKPSTSRNNAVNTLIIENANLTLLGNNFSANDMGSYVAYKFNQSEIDLSSPADAVDVTLTDYIFSNLTLTDSQFKIDIDLATLTADTITIASGGYANGEVILSDINFANVSEYAEGIVQIIKMVIVISI